MILQKFLLMEASLQPCLPLVDAARQWHMAFLFVYVPDPLNENKLYPTELFLLICYWFLQPPGAHFLSPFMPLRSQALMLA